MFYTIVESFCYAFAPFSTRMYSWRNQWGGKRETIGMGKISEEKRHTEEKERKKGEREEK